jgi:putative multicomponent Na+:H+ antiporter subunit B
MLVFQENPYHALVIRGIIGAVAALLYAVLGAADVALTEALVGTMLSIMLYAVAVRSSLVLRLGILASSLSTDSLDHLLAAIREALAPYHLRVELIIYPTFEQLQIALRDREIHALCTEEKAQLLTMTRVPRLYTILKPHLTTLTELVYYPLPSEEESAA